MGISVSHEPPEPTPPPTPETPSSTPPAIPETPPPAAGATSPQYIKLLEDTVREQNRRLNEAAASTSRPAAPPPPPAKTVEEERQEFYNDPVNSNRRLIREELEATVGPILAYVNELKGGTAIDKFVNQFKSDARFARMWDADVENYVRQQSSTVSPAQLTEQTVGFIVVSAIGMKASGILPTSSGLPSAMPETPPAPPAPTPTPAPMPTPPHMRPSAPGGPPAPAGNGKVLRALTEHEERIRRENNMTVEQFLTFQEMPSQEVAFTTFDKPKPKV